MKNKLIIALAFIGLGLLFVMMAGGFEKKLDMALLPTQAPMYQSQPAAEVSLQVIDAWQTYTGSIIADQKATLSARITAQVADVLVDVGDMVKAGDILIRLDNLDLNARVRQNEQAIASAQAQLNIARKEYTRTQSLVSKKLVAQSKLDSALSTLQSAKANFKQAQASLDEATTTYGYSIIAAPFDGLITQKNVNKGDIASPGVNMLAMYNPDSMVMQAYIAASQRHQLALNQTWPVSLPEQDIRLTGHISEINPSSDANSRSIVVKLSIDASNKQPLFPGTYAKVAIKTGTKSALIIPASSVYRIGQLQYVKLIKTDNSVVPRLVETTVDDSGVLRVTKGLSSEERVLLEPND
jgi:RND family efflux transporter MFP subunit